MVEKMQREADHYTKKY